MTRSELGIIKLTWRAVQKDTARWINSYLTVEIELRKRQLYCFSDFLLLLVQSSDIRVLDVWSLIVSEAVRLYNRNQLQVDIMSKSMFVTAYTLMDESASGGSTSTSEFECL